MNRLILLIFCLLPTIVAGQDSLRTGVKYGFLPVLSFNTDDGLLLGGELKRYDYRNALPFKSYTRVALNYYTDGAFGLSFNRNEIDFLNSGKRVSFNVFTGQNYTDYFLGDTDKLGFDEERFDSSLFYSFKSFRADVGSYIRISVSKKSPTERIDLKTGVRFIYETPWGTPTSRFIYNNDIVGSEGSFLTLADIGMVFENRKSEFNTQEGYYIELGSQYALPGISTHHTIHNKFLGLSFIPIKTSVPVTIASRLSLQNTLGETPYWFLPFLGGGSSLRGYMYRRFTSDNAIFYSLEIRSWLLKIPFKNIELGANLFLDGGKVFSKQNWNEVFIQHKHTLGFGGVISIFTPDYILKYDIGFSEEGVGIYLGTGYSF